MQKLSQIVENALSILARAQPGRTSPGRFPDFHRRISELCTENLHWLNKCRFLAHALECLLSEPCIHISDKRSGLEWPEIGPFCRGVFGIRNEVEFQHT